MNDSLYVNIASSATAGIVARIFTHPLDTAKARVQAVYGDALQVGASSSSLSQQRHPYRGPFDALLKTIRSEGLPGLYRGFPAVLIGGTPGTVLYLCSYEFAKNNLMRLWESNYKPSAGGDFLVHFSSGMIAETIACIIYVPVDVVKERMQVQHTIRQNTATHSLSYRNSFDAVKQIMRTEGLSGIYRGYGATIGSFGPFSALYFVFYEKCKLWARQHVSGSDHNNQFGRELEESVNLPFSWILLCSASSGALASWITSPLDMAKLRLQVQRGQAMEKGLATTSFRGVWDCLRHAFNEEGFRGLFRGAGARVLYFAPATTVTMTSYELCRSYLYPNL
jgi:hypothetical protein